MIGQAHAKKVLSVAVYNHYKRLSVNLPQSQQASTPAEVKPVPVQRQYAGSPQGTHCFNEHYFILARYMCTLVYCAMSSIKLFGSVLFVLQKFKQVSSVLLDHCFLREQRDLHIVCMKFSFRPGQLIKFITCNNLFSL